MEHARRRLLKAGTRPEAAPRHKKKKTGINGSLKMINSYEEVGARPEAGPREHARRRLREHWTPGGAPHT